MEAAGAFIVPGRVECIEELPLAFLRLPAQQVPEFADLPLKPRAAVILHGVHAAALARA
jgi:hypothetical protein